jgi:hypothetical protein
MMRNRILAGILITLVVFVAARRISKNRPEYLDMEIDGARITHTSVYEHVGRGEPEVILEADPAGRIVPELFYVTSEGSQRNSVGMTESGDGVWSGRLPELEKGKRIEYGFIIRGAGAGTDTRSETGAFLLKYKGEVSPTVLVLHILCMFAAFFFVVLCLFGALAILRGREGISPTVANTRWVLLFTFIGGWPLGFALNQQRFGTLWEGFPFGYDITDNKTQLMFVFWLVAMILAWSSFRGRDPRRDIAGPKAFAAAVLICVLVSFILFLVPHSL